MRAYVLLGNSAWPQAAYPLQDFAVVVYWAMANYHCTVKLISRTGGKSCVSSLAYRSATKLEDRRTGDTWDYTNKGFVGHVEILLPEGAPSWISDIALLCKVDKQAALQKLSDVFEAAETRKDSRVYREVEFSLPVELTDEQNIKWANEFIREVCCSKGMVAIMSFHFDIDPETGEKKPHCHALLSTRNLTEEGLSCNKNLDWDRKDLLCELRQQYEQYQNLALKEHGFDVRVDHRSYEDRGIWIDPQPKLGKQIVEMARRGIARDKQSDFDTVRLKNQFKIVKSPEIVFSIVTSNHSTFTAKDVAKVLNRYIDDPDQFRILYDRLMGSRELVPLMVKEGSEAVYTTREMLGIEMGLVSKGEGLSARKTHGVDGYIIEEAIARQNEKLSAYGGLSPDQEEAIRHMLSPDQISCVVGFAGAGKTTSLEAAREGWEKAGYSVLGLAPTGKAARNIEGSGIRAMTLHKFLLAQQEGREQVSAKTVLVLDEAGMVDSRRMAELVSLMERTGAKGVAMGDGHQVQAVEAGPAFRLLTDRVKPVVLETVVRQQLDWQKEATRWFGEGQAAKALSLYQQKGIFRIIPEVQLKEGLANPDRTIDNYCLARQVSGRIWKEMEADGKKEEADRVEAGKAKLEDARVSGVLDSRGKFPDYSRHPDYELYQTWKCIRQEMVQKIVEGFDGYKDELAARGVDVGYFDTLAARYQGGNLNLLGEIRAALRKMSYDNIVDTRVEAKEELVRSWVADRQGSPHDSHVMLAFTNKDANSLNESARVLMRAAGEIKGADYTVATQRIDTDDFGKEVITYHDRAFAQGDRILFTRNDNRLKVSNGTLGTILGISKQKMTVALDGAEQRTVSFSPNLYPYLDNGWATTIHKAQGVTVDHVKMLASFEQYRNLSYVGMTRHRYTLQVFGSDLDFWREEKVIDRLSRVQEKLSGFDYMDADKIAEVLAEDTTILWHDRKIGQAKDLWSAVKVTAHGLFSQITGLSRQPDKGTGEQGYPSFDHTEEKRSTKFFKDGSSQEPSSGLGGGDTASGMGDTPSPDRNINGAHSHESTFGDGSSHSPSSSSGMGDTPFQDGNTGGVHSKDGSPQSLSGHGVGNTPSRDENIRGAHKQGGAPARSVEGADAGLQGDAPPAAIQPGMPQSQDFQKEEPVVGGLDAEGKTGKAVNQAQQRPSATVTIKEKFPSFKEVEEQLKERMGELAEELLGKPTSRGKDKLKFGRKGSVCVFISGDRQGVYTNFESGVKGGPLKLIEEQQGLSSSLEALKWGSHWLGATYTVVERHTVEKPEGGKLSTWKPVMPVPKSAGNPDIKGNKYLNYMLKDGAREVSRHAYRDEQGNLKGYVFRIEKADGGKITPPLSYCENDKGRQARKWQGFEKDNKTPYGIEKLALDPTRPVLVVEGEKTADAAQKLFPECHVLTWGGGAGNVGKTNWDLLAGRDVVIWPDNDSGGHKAAEALQEIITLANAEKGKDKPVSIVALPPGVPHKWDLADPLPAGWSLDTVKGMVREALPKDIEWADNQRGAEVASTLGKTSAGIETDIGEKGEREIYPRVFEKTGAGFHQDLSPAPLPEELRDHALHERSDGLVHQKTEDGRENGGAGSQATQETPARQYNPGEAETLAFLTREIDVRKHGWLSEKFCQELLQAAAKDPLQTLNRWQDISEDYSFKPSAPTTSLTKDQVKAQEEKSLVINEKIMAYLHEEVRLEKHTWLDKVYQNRIFEKAGEDPVKGLKLWQNTSEDYSFNPFKDQLSSTELNVQKYMKQKLLQENDLTLKQNEALKATLLDNPLETYRKWQDHTGDQMFDPATGTPRKQTEVRELMVKARDSVSADLFKEWQEKVVNSPETVKQECQDILETHQHEDKIALAAKEFVILSEQYKGQSLSYYEGEKITQALKNIADPYLDDKISEKKFLEKVEGWGSKAASSRMEETLAMRERQFEDHDLQFER